jgi:putative peptidoglycan lipid II flippase
VRPAAAAEPPAPRPRRALPPVPPPNPARRRFVPGPDETQLIPTLPPVPDHGPETEEEVERREGAPGGSRGILRAAGTMAVATLVSRLTGFLRTVVLTAVLGLGLVGDAYTVANTLPNLVYELLLGGVLTSVVVPLLVSAQEKDADGGVRYAQRLLTLAVVGLGVLTAVAVLAAPALTAIMGIDGDPEQIALANWLARILLVEIVFYGVGALATAILNSRGVFGAPAWAPVLNNVVVIVTGGLFILASGPGELTPATITASQVWLLGAGTTLGIAVQALVLLPLLPRHGVPLRPSWGVRGTGLREAGTLGLWVVGYVLVSQVGVIVTSRVSNAAAEAGGLGPMALSNASLLFQMPYGIIGVALLTALLPRMSRAAARQDVEGVIADLSLGTRLSAVGLLPVTALLVVLGPALGTVAFARGNTGLEEARSVGTALAIGAVGLLPMAITLLQLRVFYAMKDARTPTLIQLVMVAVRVPLVLLVPLVVEPRHVVPGLMLVTSITFVVGWIVGDVALRRRLGTLRGRRVLGSLLKLSMVTLVAGLLGWAVVQGLDGVLGRSVPGSLGTLVVGTVVIGVAVVAGAVLVKVPEVTGALAGVRARLGR